jgi:hypothetical protein
VSVVERSGHNSIPSGAMLEVRVGPGPKGPQVSEILSVGAALRSKNRPDVHDRSGLYVRRPTEPPSRSPVRSSGTML